MMRGGGSISYAGNSTQFSYDANHQRWKQVANYGGVAETIWYIGGLLEKVTRSGVTEYRHRISAGSASAIYTRRDQALRSSGAGVRRRWTSVTMNTALLRS